MIIRKGTHKERPYQYGCGAYNCKDCYPLEYACADCMMMFDQPINNGTPYTCEECGYKGNEGNNA
jgi:hypothetical protein